MLRVNGVNASDLDDSAAAVEVEGFDVCRGAVSREYSNVLCW
jgi:hypothetical protein